MDYNGFDFGFLYSFHNNFVMITFAKKCNTEMGLYEAKSLRDCGI